MKLRLVGALVALLMATSAAQAAIDLDALAKKFLDEGYTHVEVKVLATTVKVEAIKGETKLEVVYDITSGDVVKSENGTVETGDDVTPGVFVDGRDDDSGNASSHDDEDQSGAVDDQGDDSADDNSGSGGDNETGDDSGSNGGDDGNGGSGDNGDTGNDGGDNGGDNSGSDDGDAEGEDDGGDSGHG